MKDGAKVKAILKQFLTSQGTSPAVFNNRHYIVLVFCQQSESSRVIPKLNTLSKSVKVKPQPTNTAVVKGFFSISQFIYVGWDDTTTQLDAVQFPKITDETMRRELMQLCLGDVHPSEKMYPPTAMILDYHPSLLQVQIPDAMDAMLKDTDDAKNFPYADLGVNMGHAVAAGCCCTIS